MRPSRKECSNIFKFKRRNKLRAALDYLIRLVIFVLSKDKNSVLLVAPDQSVIQIDKKQISFEEAAAKTIKQRFCDEDIARLLEMAWWDWPLDDIQAAMPLLCSGNIRDLYHYWQESVRS